VNNIAGCLDGMIIMSLVGRRNICKTLRSATGEIDGAKIMVQPRKTKNATTARTNERKSGMK
jgi:hypothetical protein